MISGLSETELFASGHRACAGCGSALVPRYALKAAGKNTIVVSATGCMEVFSTPFPETSWRVPWLHAAFENAAAVASGVHRALEMSGKRDKINLIAMGGDGATFDIGLGALSGAAERGETFCYICYENGAYMNTGAQRSGATPKYAATTTSPAGKKVHGKTEFAKQLPLIMAAHGCYVATASIAYPHDFIDKVKKALSKKGVSYIQVYAPCPTGWYFDSSKTIKIAKMAFQSRVTPLYEIEGGILKFSKKPTKDTPVMEYLMEQKRFKHLTVSEIEDVQENVNAAWQMLVEFEDKRVMLFPQTKKKEPQV